MKHKLDNGKICQVERPDTSTANKLIEYIKKVSDETDNLTFCSEEFDTSLAEEKNYINKVNNDEKSIILLAWQNGKIVGNLTMNGNNKFRLRHKTDFGMSVLKSYWGMGIGKALMEEMLSFAEKAGITKINLKVRKDNERAIGLYKKFNFKEEGLEKRGMMVDEEYIDFLLMGLML